MRMGEWRLGDAIERQSAGLEAGWLRFVGLRH